MKTPSLFLVLLAVILSFGCNNDAKKSTAQYAFNSEPLAANSFAMLPLGAVKPAGWLENQLIIQKNSLTGHLDEFWPDLVTSSWRGGDGEAWDGTGKPGRPFRKG